MYRFNESQMFYDVADGIGIVINFTSGIYYSFNLIGTAVFDRILAGADPAKVAGALSELDGCPAEMNDLMNGFVNDLLEKGVLLSDEGAFADAADASIEAAKTAEGFGPVFDEYNEVQDLIMADPVHDVDPNMGWPVLKDEFSEE